MEKEKQIIEEMRDTLANINETNGIHILGYYPLAEELVKQGYRKESKDVVPRSEVEEIVKFKDMAYAELKSLFIEAKQEVAKQIFEEIEKYVKNFSEDKYYQFWHLEMDVAELKKKYIGE